MDGQLAEVTASTHFPYKMRPDQLLWQTNSCKPNRVTCWRFQNFQSTISADHKGRGLPLGYFLVFGGKSLNDFDTSPLTSLSRLRIALLGSRNVLLYVVSHMIFRDSSVT